MVRNITRTRSRISTLPSSVGCSNSSACMEVQQESSPSRDYRGEKVRRALQLEEETQHSFPKKEILDEEIDALCSHDMQKLSMREREAVLHEIHGVAGILEETDEMLQEKVEKIVNDLSGLVSSAKVETIAYEKALQQNADYVRDLQVPFLRAEMWNSRFAADRMVAFFEEKLRLFGPELLTKDIKLSHLDKEDRKSLESGFFQLLAARDVAERAIMTGIPGLKKYKVLENLQRAYYYMMMTAFQDESTQKSGVVFVGYNMGKSRAMDKEAVWAIQKMRKVVPMRVASMHYCYDKLYLVPMMTVARLVMGAAGRVRFRSHYGTPKDAMYQLLTFGIPESALPFNENGEPKVKNHQKWLKSRRKLEDSAGDHTDVIVVPGGKDVLFGRGKPFQEHFGNLRYRALLDHFQYEYEEAPKYAKMAIAKRLIQTVQQYNGRFLKQTEGGWVVVDEAGACDKVSHAFRTRRAAGITAPVLPPIPMTSSSYSSMPDSKRKAMNDDTSECPAIVPSTLDMACGAPVTDSENEGSTFGEDNEDHSCGSPSSPMMEKRAKLWTSEFHPVSELLPVSLDQL